ncbi:MAG: hypothetical protein M3N17_05295 [Actinomycetota bacterium]|nr:hypothetical protein [Actinomycetota bacterium]
MTTIDEGPQQPRTMQPEPIPLDGEPAEAAVAPVSGLYVRRGTSHAAGLDADVRLGVTADDADEIDEQIDLDEAEPDWDPAEPASTSARVFERLRLDVDGHYPQMVVSGRIQSGITSRLHWIARLRRTAPRAWSGSIFYKNGDPNLLRHTAVRVAVHRSHFPHHRRARVVFTGAGAPRVRLYRFASRRFHQVEFEYDAVQGTTPTTVIDTHAHPNRPATLPREDLSIERIFSRAGFDVRKTSQDSVIPLAEAGPDVRWSDQEMHDAMQVYWSRFANVPQWSLWTLFAALHDSGPSLGGIMFDDIGPNHRQGTALFNDSFISQAPTGDANPAAWIRRMRFWTAVHEMGHAFNLAHSWQKSLGVAWLPLVDEPEARSPMNYPFRVAGGQTAFFADFEYRFSDAELLFLRHAPGRFVEMGNADWFDHHGFEQAAVSAEPTFALHVRVNRPRMEFEWLEPVRVELKLENVSGRPQVVDASRLAASDDLTVIVKKRGSPARRFRPFARYCRQPDEQVLGAGESLYESLFVSAGLNGWDFAEPGKYLVQIALHLEDEDVVSQPLVVRVAPPRSYEEEYLAQDFFSDDVGRALAFSGSRVLDGANDTLHEVAERLPDRRVARHARYALGAPLASSGKRLQIEAPEGATGLAEGTARIATTEPDVEAARQELSAALDDDMGAAAETFGHIPFKRRVDGYSRLLLRDGESAQAAGVLGRLLETMSARGVIAPVLADIGARRDALESEAERG